MRRLLFSFRDWLAFTAGETTYGVRLIDAQHRDDFVNDLSIRYAHPLGDKEAAISIRLRLATARGGNVFIRSRLKPGAWPARNREEVKEMEEDVICGMQVDPKKAASSSEYQGKTYYFCSLGCKRRFDQNPEQHAKS